MKQIYPLFLQLSKLKHFALADNSLSYAIVRLDLLTFLFVHLTHRSKHQYLNLLALQNQQAKRIHYNLHHKYSYVAGHSLGEYSALYAAGVFSFEDGLRLVGMRGRSMAAQNGKGTMAAVLGMTEEELKSYMNDGVVMANLNSKTQIVISGTNKGVNEVEEKLKDRIEAEEIKFRRLSVSAAFHSPQMTETAEVMREEIEKADMREPKAFVVSNVTGKPTKDLLEIKANLIAQITGQVRWYDSILNMKDAGVEQYYEIGNGEVLKKMNKSITLRPKCLSI